MDLGGGERGDELEGGSEVGGEMVEGLEEFREHEVVVLLKTLGV